MCMWRWISWKRKGVCWYVIQQFYIYNAILSYVYLSAHTNFRPDICHARNQQHTQRIMGYDLVGTDNILCSKIKTTKPSNFHCKGVRTKFIGIRRTNAKVLMKTRLKTRHSYLSYQNFVKVCRICMETSTMDKTTNEGSSTQKRLWTA